MNVLVNGEPRSLAEGSTLAQALDDLGIGHSGIAIAVNADVIPRARVAEVRLREGDALEIVKAVAGG